MYKYGLHTLHFILLISGVYVKNSSNYDLEYWTRQPQFDKRYRSNNHYYDAAKSNLIVRRHLSRKVYDARSMLEKFLHDLNNDNHTSTIDFYSTSSNMNVFSAATIAKSRNGERNSVSAEANSADTRSKHRNNSKVIYRNSTPQLRSIKSEEDSEYRKRNDGHRNKMRLAQGDAKPAEEVARDGDAGGVQEKPQEQRRPTSKNHPEEDNKTNLSPFSFLQQLQDYILPSYRDINITSEVIGRTIEYNDIVMLKVALPIENKVFRSEKDKYTDDEPEKKIIFIVHGLTVMGFNSLPCMRNVRQLRKLLSYYFKHLNHFNIYIIPMANPDGVAAVTAKQLWNKNISPQEACPGVALDRNFDVAWNSSHGLSSCSQLYPGPNPFSEAETQAVRNVFNRYSHKIVAYIHVHSGTYTSKVFKGDAVLYPRGFTEQQTDDDKYIDIRGEVDEAMRNASFKVLSVAVDTLFNWYGRVSGTSVDYASSVYGIPYAMEFVMQLYDDDMLIDVTEERETGSILTEVWRRVIDVVLSNMARSLQRLIEAAEEGH